MSEDKKFSLEEAMGRDREAFAKLASSGEAQQLMSLLKQQSGSVEQAAKKAAMGDTSQLMQMVQQLMSSQEGSELVNKISTEAKKNSKK